MPVPTSILHQSEAPLSARNGINEWSRTALLTISQLKQITGDLLFLPERHYISAWSFQVFLKGITSLHEAFRFS